MFHDDSDDDNGIASPDNSDNDNGIASPDNSDNEENGIASPDNSDNDDNGIASPDNSDNEENGIFSPDNSDNDNGIASPDNSDNDNNYIAPAVISNRHYSPASPVTAPKDEKQSEDSYDNDINDFTHIFLAVYDGDVDRFHRLLDPHDLEEHIRQKTMMHVAASRGHVQFVDLLWRLRKCLIGQKDAFGNTPLHLAVKYNHTKVMNQLLKKRPNICATNDSEMSPISLAIARNHVHLARILLKNGANVNFTDMQRVVSIAAETGRFGMVQLFLKNRSLLHYSVVDNHLSVLKYLIENGVKMVPETRGVCLLDQCKTNDHLEVLKYLIHLDVKYRTNRIENPLLYSSLASGDLEIWKYLTTQISRIYSKLYSGNELHEAVRAGQVKSVKENVNRIKRGKQKYDFPSRALAVFIAVESRNEKILTLLLQAGYPVETCFHDQLSPVHIAATFEDTRFLQILVKFGARINSRTLNDLTPLDFAAAAGSANAVKFILDADAYIFKINRDATTALEYALRRNSNIIRDSAQSIVTPSMFWNLLKITEMLLINGICDRKDEHHYEDLLIYAINLRVASENSNLEDVNEANERKGEFRPEIVRCLLNYFEKDKINESLDLIMNKNYALQSPEVLDVILEYYTWKSQIKIFHLHRDYLSNVHLIERITNADHLLCVAEQNDKRFDLLRIITARLVLLPGDKRLEGMKNLFYATKGLFLWRNICVRQILSMRNTRIVDELNVSFYDILKKPINKVANYIRDEKFLKNFEKSYEQFSAYALFLKMRVENGKQRNCLRDSCVNGMFRFVKQMHKIQFSFEGIDEILQYLSVIDLRRLSGAYS